MHLHCRPRGVLLRDGVCFPGRVYWTPSPRRGPLYTFSSLACLHVAPGFLVLRSPPSVVCSAVLRVLVFLDFVYWLNLKYSRAPDPLRGVEERCPWRAPPRWLRLGRAARCVQSPQCTECFTFNEHRRRSSRPQPWERFRGRRCSTQVLPVVGCHCNAQKERLP